MSKDNLVIRNQEQIKIGKKKETNVKNLDVSTDENLTSKNSSFLDDIKNESKNPNQKKERGFVNEKSKSSILLRDNGNINISADKLLQINMNKSNKSIRDTSYYKEVVTNRLSIKTEDLEVNEHKFNQRFWELADQRLVQNNEDVSIGNLNIGGYVLMKHWEQDLGKWVLIRRKTRLPLFYPEKTLPNTPEKMGIDTKIDLDHKPLVGDLSEKLTDMFGLDEKDPSYQAAEYNIELDEDALILDSQILDPKEEIIIDMGPIDANTNTTTKSTPDEGGLGALGDNTGGTSITGDGTDQAGNPINLLAPGLPPKQLRYNKTQTVTYKMPDNYETTQPNDSRINRVPPDVMCYNMNKVGDLKLSPHFKLSQFKSGCGSPYVLISPLLIQKLEQLCSNLGVSYIRINSGYRSPAHNQAIKRQGYKAADNSQHTFGRAADLWISNSIGPKQIERAARRLNFAYVYSKSGFCHVNV